MDTSKPFTVVTQFISSNNSSTGDLVDIRRLWIQNDKVIQNPQAVSGKGNSLTESFCETSKLVAERGGVKAMGQSLSRGMVLVFSIWNDPEGFMAWLDGGNNGPCNATEGDPKNIKARVPGTSVTFSNIKWGDLGTTYSDQ